jgi:uncharacterized protein
MTVELRPLGVLCNIACEYCYQNPQRAAHNIARRYDIDVMKAAVEEEGGPFTLFGGEPLLLPLRDLEDIWAWGLERYGSNSVQTNGTTIRAEHIELFRRYNVHVGISIDGPGRLNAVRSARSGSDAATAKATARSEQAIERLCAAGIRPGLIVTLHKVNATEAALDEMNAWFRRLDALGIRSVVLHVLESESADIRAAHGLTTGQSIQAFMNFYALQKTLTSLSFSVFAEIRDLLLGNDEQVSCVWTGCDPYTTRAVRGVEGSGKRTNCGRVNKEGIDFEKSDTPGYERYIALHHASQSAGGCRGCRFFLACKGYCPGTSIGGDWRNRTEYCELWKHLFAHCEQELLRQGHVPLSLREDRPQLERRMVAAWSAGRNPGLGSLMATDASSPPRACAT